MDAVRLRFACCCFVTGVILAAPNAIATGENLLANPGFESLSADQPNRWDNFVQPKPGAVARIDDEAHAGRYSVWLHTPTPYAKEPVNNWSQNIIAQFGGSTLQISGFVRVTEAKEAAIWLQCWRKKPWGVLAASSTSTDMPVYGTAEWQEVSMSVEVPKGTDFVTLRCVLMGTGSAWFDDISVTRVRENVTEEDTKTVVEPKTTTNTEKNDESPAPEKDEPVEASASAPPVAAESAKQEALVMPLVTELESELRRLREANVLLVDTLRQIQNVNQGLVNEVMAIQSEVRDIKEGNARAEAPPLVSSVPLVPPLIPLSEAKQEANK